MRVTGYIAGHDVSKIYMDTAKFSPIDYIGELSACVVMVPCWSYWMYRLAVF